MVSRRSKTEPFCIDHIHSNENDGDNTKSAKGGYLQTGTLLFTIGNETWLLRIDSLQNRHGYLHQSSNSMPLDCKTLNSCDGT